MRNSTQRAIVLMIVTAALSVGAAASAAAAPDWNYGLPVDDYEQTCLSIGGGIGYYEEVGTRVRAGQYIDAQNLPRVGEDFYGAVSIAAAGGCSAKSALPEVIPPAGVELAVSARESRALPTTRCPTAPTRRSSTAARRPPSPEPRG